MTGRGYRFSLAAAIDEALKALEPKFAEVKKKPGEAPLKEQVLEFIRGRLESTWRETHRPDVVDAVLAAGFDDLVAAQKRLEAISKYVGQADFAALAATFKRVANIVEKQAKDVSKAPVDPATLTLAVEKTLFTQVSQVRDAVLAAVKVDDYAGALAKVVPLKSHVDAFFDGVMVISDDPAVKANRVRLLMEIAGLFGTVADFSKIQAEAS